jgi:hypothetical protein
MSERYHLDLQPRMVNDEGMGIAMCDSLKAVSLV